LWLVSRRLASLLITATHSVARSLFGDTNHKLLGLHDLLPSVLSPRVATRIGAATF
jgi:hypothetical protein